MIRPWVRPWLRRAARAAGPVAALLLLAACDRAPPGPPPTPALWEVSGPKGEHGFLFGTVHSLPSGTQWRNAAIERAYAASGVLAVEVDLAARRAEIGAIFERLARSPGLPPLSQRLSGPEREALLKAMAGKGLDDGDFAGMESWAAAIVLSQAYEEGSGGDGVDLALIEQAKGKRVVELEGAEPQLRLFDALPEADQRDLLAAVAKEALAGEAPGDARLKGWLSGDTASLEAETHEGLLADPELRAVLLVARNRDWAGRIAEQMAGGKTVFVAVGAAHLVGPDGLAALLAQRGYTVTRVE